MIVAGKQPAPQWLDMDAAIGHCARGIGIWEWASNDDGRAGRRDGVLRRRADAGDAGGRRRCCARTLPELRIRVVNVVDLMTLQPPTRASARALRTREFDAIFTTDKPVIFAFHGYPWLIHRLTYRRTNHGNLHVRGYKEEGTTTTPFDMAVLNDLDRYHLVADVIDRVPSLRANALALRQRVMDARAAARRHTREFGIDAPDVTSWTWPGQPRDTAG